MKYICSICYFVYDEDKGIPEAGIAAGTKWEELPVNWVCPICGAGKSEFRPLGAPETAKKPVPVMETAADVKELSPLEMSALCSNLARGCEKQYKPEEAALFAELAAYYKAASAPAEEPSFGKLMDLVEKDLNAPFPAANATAADTKDRGALRALAWSEKVTRILKSLLARYEKEGDAMIEGTGVYVCTICGFVFVGDDLPEICPVCKVPNWKFEKIEGRAI
ncbi:MAG: rubredoxin [Christensenellales bacterium]|jgi:rubredoxin